MEERLRRLVEAGTCVIADIYDKMGLVPLVLDNHLVPFSGSREEGIAGPAYTVNGTYQSWAKGADRDKLAAIDQMTPGVVALWAGNNVSGVCLFGDLLAAAMQARGCRGVIVDGGIRDIVELRKLELPIYARYCSPAQSIRRWHVNGFQVPVEVGGALAERITVHPGDIVVADQDGVVIVPQGRLDDFVDEVSRLASTESKARQDIARGKPLLETLDKFGLP